MKNNKNKNNEENNDMSIDEAMEQLDKGFEEYESMTLNPQSCDWCGRSPVTYSNEAHDLCENCSDQMFGI